MIVTILCRDAIEVRGCDIEDAAFGGDGAAVGVDSELEHIVLAGWIAS